MKTKTRNLSTKSGISLGTCVKALAALALTAVIVACGGGGGSDPVATPTTPTTPITPVTCTAPAVLTNGSCVTPVTPTPSNKAQCDAKGGNYDAPSGQCTVCAAGDIYDQPGVCRTPAVPVICTPPKVLTNGVCVTPPVTPPTIVVPPAQPQNVKVYISAANTLPAGCDFTYQACWADSVNNGTVLIINGGGQNRAYYKANGRYMIRAIGSDGLLVYGSRSVTDYGVSALLDWVMGTSAGIIIHQATDNTCFDSAYNIIACPS